MRKFLIAPIVVFLILFTATVALGSTPSPEPPSSASVTTEAIQNVDTPDTTAVSAQVETAGEVGRLRPGCPPSTHVNPILGPWDPGGHWMFPRPWDRPAYIRLGITKGWFNLDAPSIRDDPNNPGQPKRLGQRPWKTLVTPKIVRSLGGIKVQFWGIGGEAYIYKNNKACRYNVPREFRRGNEQIIELKWLVNNGYAQVYN